MTVSEWVRLPLFAVTLATKLPGETELHERIELPEPLATVVGERVHDRLGELVVTVRVTVPAKPFVGLTVNVEFPAMLVLGEILAGLAVRAKSGTFVT